MVVAAVGILVSLLLLVGLFIEAVFPHVLVPAVMLGDEGEQGRSLYRTGANVDLVPNIVPGQSRPVPRLPVGKKLE